MQLASAGSAARSRSRSPGGLLLAVAVFLPWYDTSDNPNAEIDGARGDFSAWDVHPIMRWLLLAAAAAPLILAWIVLRDHELSWPRGEMTAVVGDRRARPGRSTAGFIFQPGRAQRSQISLQLRLLPRADRDRS